MIAAITHASQVFYQKKGEGLDIRLTRFDGQVGIVKCLQEHKEKTIEIVQSIKRISSHNVHITTVGTSGTIHSLLHRPVLKTLRKTNHK